MLWTLMPSAVRIPASLSCWMARDPFELYDGDLVEDFENLTSAENTTWSSIFELTTGKRL
jgi:hypothetical protein